MDISSGFINNKVYKLDDHYYLLEFEVVDEPPNQKVNFNVKELTDEDLNSALDSFGPALSDADIEFYSDVLNGGSAFSSNRIKQFLASEHENYNSDAFATVEKDAITSFVDYLPCNWIYDEICQNPHVKAHPFLHYIVTYVFLLYYLDAFFFLSNFLESLKDADYQDPPRPDDFDYKSLSFADIDDILLNSGYQVDLLSYDFDLDICIGLDWDIVDLPHFSLCFNGESLTESIL